MHNKVVYVPSSFVPTGKYQTQSQPTGESTKNWLGQTVPVYEKRDVFVPDGISDSEINGQQLANDIALVVAELNSQGYEVISVTAVESGRHRTEWTFNNHGGAGYGFSYTKGVIVIARLIR